jgi:DNA-binding MarR family transcriptional regulator
MSKKASETNASDELAYSRERLRALSTFRYALRRFLRFSEDAARETGITALQYQLLLHIGGADEGRLPTIGELAELLQAKPNGVVALVTRCEELGLVRRQPSRHDGRQVEVRLLAKGRQCLNKMVSDHQDELLMLADAVEAARQETTRPPR